MKSIALAILAVGFMFTAIQPTTPPATGLVSCLIALIAAIAVFVV